MRLLTQATLAIVTLVILFFFAKGMAHHIYYALRAGNGQIDSVVEHHIRQAVYDFTMMLFVAAGYVTISLSANGAFE